MPAAVATAGGSLREKALDRLHCIEVFCEVARCGSFSAAAVRFGVSRATVTKQVAWLERSLNVRLLNRTTKRVGLTDAGLRVLEGSAPLLEHYEAIEANVRDALSQPRGVIRIGTPPSFGVHHLLGITRGFIARHPDIQVSLLADDGRASLIDETLDLSIRIVPSMEDASFVAQSLVRVPQRLVASPAYLARAGVPTEPRDLARHNCLVHTLKAPTGIWRFVGPRGEASVRVSGGLASNLGETLMYAARAGDGLSIHPTYMIAGDLADGTLVPVLPAWRPTELDITVIYSNRRSLPRRVTLFLQYLRSWARRPPAWSRAAAQPAGRAGARSGDNGGR